MKKKGIRGLAFLCLVMLLIGALNDILCVKSPHGVDQTRYLYKQPKDKIDVLFLGSSHVHCLSLIHIFIAYLCLFLCPSVEVHVNCI